MTLVPMPPEVREDFEASPGALAGLAADLIRSLNHATFGGFGRLVYPSDAYDVISNLKRLADGLPQAIAQLNVFLGNQLADGRVIVDGGDDPHGDKAAAALALTLGAASAHAYMLGEDLAAAQNVASKLGAAE